MNAKLTSTIRCTKIKYPQRPTKLFDPNRFTPDEKKITPPKPKYNLIAETAKKKKNTGQADLFLDIWNKRPHRSEISGEPLGDDAYPTFFLHVLPKAEGKYPLFILYPKNIVLGTFEEHFIWDKARHKATGPKWKKLLDLEKELKTEYQKLTKK